MIEIININDKRYQVLYKCPPDAEQAFIEFKKEYLNCDTVIREKRTNQFFFCREIEAIEFTEITSES